VSDKAILPTEGIAVGVAVVGESFYCPFTSKALEQEDEIKFLM
jgi:hypothetical protein